jgi:hypothetical protein
MLNALSFCWMALGTTPTSGQNTNIVRIRRSLLAPCGRKTMTYLPCRVHGFQHDTRRFNRIRHPEGLRPNEQHRVLRTRCWLLS